MARACWVPFPVKTSTVSHRAWSPFPSTNRRRSVCTSLLAVPSLSRPPLSYLSRFYFASFTEGSGTCLVLLLADDPGCDRTPEITIREHREISGARASPTATACPISRIPSGYPASAGCPRGASFRNATACELKWSGSRSKPDYAERSVWVPTCRSAHLLFAQTRPWTDMKRLQRLVLVFAKLRPSVGEPALRNKLFGGREVVGATICGPVIDSNGGLWCGR